MFFQVLLIKRVVGKFWSPIYFYFLFYSYCPYKFILRYVLLLPHLRLLLFWLNFSVIDELILNIGQNPVVILFFFLFLRMHRLDWHSLFCCSRLLRAHISVLLVVIPHGILIGWLFILAGPFEGGILLQEALDGLNLLPLTKVDQIGCQRDNIVYVCLHISIFLSGFKDRFARFVDFITLRLTYGLKYDVHRLLKQSVAVDIKVMVLFSNL